MWILKNFPSDSHVPTHQTRKQNLTGVLCMWAEICNILWWAKGFPGGSDGKESACNARDLGSIPGLRRFPRGEHGNPLQYSCLENPYGQRSLAGYSAWGRKESDTTERLSAQLLLLLLSHFSRVRLCATPLTAAHQAPPSLGFSRQEHWSGLPFPSPKHTAWWAKGHCPQPTERSE